jgi:hypothetical protein
MTRSESLLRAPKSKGTSSQYRGVFWDKTNKKWSAVIRSKAAGGVHRLGNFINEADAARAYDAAARRIYGPLAQPNFPKPGDTPPSNDTSRNCTRCGILIEPTWAQRKNSSFRCKSCVKASNEGRRKPYIKIQDLSPLDQKKRKARTSVMNALKSGRLIKQSCRKCGKPAQAHHEDYDRPLDVIWLCSEHHAELHAMNRVIQGGT